MYFLPLFKTFFLGSQSVLTYATSHGLICGWDLRSSKLAWKLENDPSHGNVNVIIFFFQRTRRKHCPLGCYKCRLY